MPAPALPQLSRLLHTRLCAAQVAIPAADAKGRATLALDFGRFVIESGEQVQRLDYVCAIRSLQGGCAACCVAAAHRQGFLVGIPPIRPSIAALPSHADYSLYNCTPVPC